MEKILKLKLLWYLLISGFSFSYLILPEYAGISVPVFIVIQFSCLYFLVPNNKPLLVFIPIFILSLNSFISANTMWRIPNFFIIVLLYSVMTSCITCGFKIKDTSCGLIFEILKNIFKPFKFFSIPFKWFKNNKQYKNIPIRMWLGMVISTPLIIFLLVILSSSDKIFSYHVSSFLNVIFKNLNFGIVFKILFGCIAGFYLFGLLYSMYQPRNEQIISKKKKIGDLIILFILHISVLCIYTVFVAIQFKYLFANKDNLPYDLTYTEYARQGFFELLFLTGLNIIFILITIRVTKEKTGKPLRFIKISCGYLCAITMILLISSFYRMWLYNIDLGFTRLRFLVFGFLILEAVGLIFTFFYIVKPKFNIIAVYSIIGLIYYLILNIVPIDVIIAKDHVQRFIGKGEAGIEYLVTLSIDAAPEILKLLESDNQSIRDIAYNYFENNREYYNNYMKYWQQWNLSVNRFMNISLPEGINRRDAK